MLRHVFSAVLLTGLLLAALPLKGADAKAELVDNPSYKAWANYKPGTFVTHQTASVVGEGSTPPQYSTDMTLKLQEVTANQVVLQTTAIVTMNQKKQAPQTQTLTIPAKITREAAALPPGMNYDQSKTRFKELQNGKEYLSVKGRDVETTFRTYELKTKVGDRDVTTTLKVWTAESIPGGIVQSEAAAESPAKMSVKMTVTDYKIER